MYKSKINQYLYYFSFFLSSLFEDLSIEIIVGKQKGKVYLRLIFPFILSFVSMSNTCYGQKEMHTTVSTPMIDSLISREMAYFTIAGASGKKHYSTIKMQKIPLYYSDSTYITFDNGNWVTMKWQIDVYTEPFDISKHKITYGDKQDSTIIAIDNLPFWGVSSSLPRSKVKAIGFYHYKRHDTLPESAFDGIFEPSIYYCLSKKDRKKPQNYFKAYSSEDNNRLYIYMLNGEGKDRYEVIWVINNLEYYGRYINKVPN